MVRPPSVTMRRAMPAPPSSSARDLRQPPPAESRRPRPPTARRAGDRRPGRPVPAPPAWSRSAPVIAGRPDDRRPAGRPARSRRPARPAPSSTRRTRAPAAPAVRFVLRAGPPRPSRPRPVRPQTSHRGDRRARSQHRQDAEQIRRRVRAAAGQRRPAILRPVPVGPRRELSYPPTTVAQSALDFQLVIDCADPHALADWWGRRPRLGREQGDEDFVRKMIDQGFWRTTSPPQCARLVWKTGAAINHPDGPGERPVRILFQQVPEPKTSRTGSTSICGRSPTTRRNRSPT